MIIYTEGTVRTDVENLFLREMVEEDRRFIAIGEGDDSAIDDLTPEDEHTSLFEDSLSEDLEDTTSDDDLY